MKDLAPKTFHTITRANSISMSSLRKPIHIFYNLTILMLNTNLGRIRECRPRGLKEGMKSLLSRRLMISSSEQHIPT